MGMGRAGGAFQNATNNVQNGMGGKGGQQPQGGFRGKGGAQQTQGGFGGKGAGRFQPQQPPQPPQGGFSGKGGQQQQNPYAQQYYQPQFQPEYFNNPYSQGGFGQQPQMGGFGGKGGQQVGLGQAGLSPQQANNIGQQLVRGQQPRFEGPMVQGGLDQYGNLNGSDASRRAAFAREYQQYEQQRGGMGGKGGQQVGLGQAGLSPQQANNLGQQLVRGQQPQMGGMRGKGGNINQVGPDGRPLGAPGFSGFSGMNKMGGMGGSQSNLPEYAQPYFASMLRGLPQRSGLAALQQPTATTQAASPAPEQPYMGNYLK